MGGDQAVQAGDSDEAREALRQRLIGETPRWYNPWLHLALPSAFGLGVVALCVRRLDGLRAAELCAVPLTWLVANVGEWRAHKYLLHKRSRWAPILYDRHAPQHHRVYLTDDMAMRDRREFRLVLIPAYGIGLIFLSALAPAAAMWALGLKNEALLFVATDMAYVLSYEWLHLSYHAPPDSFVGRLGVVRWLRRHHALHHDPRLMQRWNFNVTVPFWDWVRGTLVKSVAEAEARDAARDAARAAARRAAV